MTGKRIYVTGTTVNAVKRAVGKLAKKVRTASNGTVEVIHTHNGTGPSIRGRRRPGIWRLYSAVESCGTILVN
jgi:hypothetical protein